MEKDNKKHEGHYKSLGVTIGFASFAGIGIPISIIFDNMSFIGIGVIAGVLLGSIIGEAMEKKQAAAGNIRPMNEEEIKKKKNQIKILMLLGLLGFVVLMYFQLR
ncbi:MAG: hypothetical protein C0596_00330 [Marinilabiliales bacterium]|nr:MAG: hypothetical protein C0596_00330 [Marinilabiliales bacterium]